LRVPAYAVRLDRDRQRRLAHLAAQRRGGALFGQQRRVDAAGQVAQVVQRRLQGFLEQRCDRPDPAGILGRFLQQAEPDGQRDELLLRPVVQIPLDPPPLRVLRFHQPPARGPQFVDGRLQLSGEPAIAEDQARLRNVRPAR
jgi:hypothetical protein